MKAILCEKWTYDIPAANDDLWFTNWVTRSPQHVSRHITAGWHAYAAIAAVYPGGLRTAREYFGGIGAQSLIIQDMFAPLDHTVVEWSAKGAEYLRDALPNVHVVHADAYDPASVAPAQLVGLDFGDLTAHRTREGWPHRLLLDRVATGAPDAIVLTDVAGPRHHLQWRNYERLLGEGTCSTYDAYLAAFLLRIRSLYGWDLVAGYTSRWSTVMALAPTGVAPVGQMNPVPTSPVGLSVQ